MVAVSQIVRLELPAPPKELSPNARSDWHVVAREKATYKNACYLLARNARQLADGVVFPLNPPVTVIVTFVVPDRRRRDFDNLLSALKAGFDGIVAAEVLADDSAWDLRLGMEIEVGKQAGVRVTLEGAP